MLNRCVCAVLAAVLLAPSARAQLRGRNEYALGLEWRTQVGALADTAERRNGLSIRIQGEIPWKKYVGWRVEGAYVQVKYTRTDLGEGTPITETDFELGGFARVSLRPKARWRPYIMGGPLGSLRGSCDISNAFGESGNVRCGEGEDILLGWGAGAGIKLTDWVGGWNWFLETRVLSNVTAVSGGRMFAISFGAGM
jgi:hypothetical protein